MYCPLPFTTQILHSFSIQVVTGTWLVGRHARMNLKSGSDCANHTTQGKRQRHEYAFESLTHNKPQCVAAEVTEGGLQNLFRSTCPCSDKGIIADFTSQQCTHFATKTLSFPIIHTEVCTVT